MKREHLFAELGAETPLALLPVRLETRYFVHKRENVLGIRIHPDTIHADDHHRGVTEREIDATLRYWRWIWADAADDVVHEARAWLAKQVGAHRAPYVAGHLRPLNADKPGGQPEFPKRTPSSPPPIAARMLPDEWHVRIYGPQGGLRFEGYFAGPGDGLVMAPSLVSGHDTGVEDPRGAVRGFLTDQDLAWTVDFDAALDAGMAIRIPTSDLPPRISTLLVYGARHDRKPLDEAAELFDLFDAHRFRRGLDVVPQGTPTNNSDAGRSGMSLDDPDVDALFDLAERPGPGPRRALVEWVVQAPASIYAAAGADAVSLALGNVAPNAFDHTAHSHWADGAAAWAMNMGVGYATIGGFLSGPFLRTPASSALDGDVIADLRDWYSLWARGGAAIPTIRCGEQPYGIMPITAPPRSAANGTDFRAGLEVQLAAMVDLWRAALPVPSLDPDATDGRPGTSPDDAIADVASVLGAVPHPAALQLRDATDWGQRDLDSLQFNLDMIHIALAGESFTPGNPKIQGAQALLDAWAPHKAVLDAREGSTASIDEQYSHAVDWIPELEDLRVTWEELHANDVGNALAYAENVVELLTPYAIATDLLPAVLDPLHEREGLGMDGRMILTGTVFQPDALSLQHLVAIDHAAPLYALDRWFTDARHELEQLIADGTLDQRTSQVDEGPLLAHLLDITYQSAPVDQLPWVSLAFWILSRISLLDAPVTRPDPDPDAPVPDGADGPVGITTNPFGGDVMATSTVVELYERLLRESLGLAMYRLDAWVLSLANEEFAQRRKAQPDGVHVGAFGWLVDLERSHEPTSQGYIHAPTLNHAASAAVLRAGWSAFGTSDAQAPLSVNLSSDRVRRGQWILDGLRNGQDLARVLGARFERLLHDARLDAFIAPVREAVLGALGEPLPANDIVDGLVLARAIAFEPVDRTTREQAVAEAIQALTRAAVGADRRRWDQVRTAAHAVSADLDSVADIVLFQSVHSLLGGDHATANAATAISSGADASVPPITGTASPRDGQQVAHRVMALLDSDTAPAGVTVGDEASPDVVAWIESLLPAPSQVAVGWTPEGGTMFRLALADLGLDVIDAFLLAGDGVSQIASDLGRVVTALAVGSTAGSGTLDTTLQFSGPDEVNLDEFGLLASRLADAVGRSRALAATDLVTPDIDASGDRYVVSIIESRIVAADAALDQLRTDVQSNLEADRRGALARAAAIGVTGALVALEADVAAGDPDVVGVGEAIDARRPDTVPAPAGERLGSADEAAGLVETLRGMVGRRLPVAVPFDAVFGTDDSAAATDLQARADVVTWMRRVGRVRGAVGAVDEALLLTHAAGGAVDDPVVVQFPAPTVPWVATGAPAGRGDHLSAVSVTGFGPDGSRLAGLLFDSWSETIPRSDQLTGLAVHFDAPSARPPQTILLPTVEDGGKYTSESLAAQLLFTLDLAKIRAVGPIDLGLGQLFPAIYIGGDIDTADDARVRDEALS